MSDDFMKKTCIHCPYRHDVKPFLRPERGEELAYYATNPYNSFPCHKTTEASENDDGESEMLVTEKSKVCAGFLTLMWNELGKTPYDEDGFKPSDECYNSTYEMIDAYTYEDATP